MEVPQFQEDSPLPKKFLVTCLSYYSKDTLYKLNTEATSTFLKNLRA